MPLDITLNRKRFLKLLSALVDETPKLQNNPPAFVPEEDRAARHVLAALEPWSRRKGGPLEVEHVSYVKGRGNVIITCPGTGKGTVSFVGAHFDVVPADPTGWKRNPFRLKVEGDRLYARGVTDCLGHVALLTDFFQSLAERRPRLSPTVVAVLIANEESSAGAGIGIDGLMRDGRLDRLRNGPVYWLDSADIHPNIGTGGMVPWSLTARGKLFHSGMPDRGINALELAMEAVRAIQRRFYEAFPKHPDERRWRFTTPSSMKPTQIRVPEGSLNQIPGECTVNGDIRLTPFYGVEKVMAAVERFVREMDVRRLPALGPSRFSLPREKLRGALSLRWLGHAHRGIACDLRSPGYRALRNAVREVLGEVKPFSTTGSLPLVGDLKDAGFDVQITGFGREDTYHAPNEFGLLSDFARGTRILSRILDAFNR